VSCTESLFFAFASPKAKKREGHLSVVVVDDNLNFASLRLLVLLKATREKHIAFGERRRNYSDTRASLRREKRCGVQLRLP